MVFRSAFVLPLAAVVLIFLLDAAVAAERKKKEKKEKEEITQVLDTPKQPPNAAVAEASRLNFITSPLSNRGLLSQQVRDGLKSLLGSARGAGIIHIRAFAAGSGDMRRIPAIVGETFEDRRLSLPAVTVVQVGELPLEGAQVAFEAITAEKKTINPGGIAFISAHKARATEAAGTLSKALEPTGIPHDAVRRITCYLHSLEYLPDLRTVMAAQFPKAAATYMQLRRDTNGDAVICESVASVSTPGTSNPVIAFTGPGRVVLSGLQMAFGREESDVQLAYARLRKDLEQAGANYEKPIFARVYGLTGSSLERAQKLAGRAGLALVFEGLPSTDASFGTDVVTSVR